MNKEAEKLRFNALSPDAAAKLISEMEGKQPILRSCWYCNGGHDHLKEADSPINCAWGCGGWYLKGFPAPIVAMRADGEEITDEIMLQLETALAAA